jgi:hypothetical protein
LELGASTNQWTTPVNVAKRESQNPKEGARVESREIARFPVLSRQRADDGAQSSEEDGNARGSRLSTRK